MAFVVVEIRGLGDRDLAEGRHRAGSERWIQVLVKAVGTVEMHHVSRAELFDAAGIEIEIAVGAEAVSPGDGQEEQDGALFTAPFAHGDSQGGRRSEESFDLVER